MARINFLRNCRRTLNDCTRILLSDNVQADAIQPTITRMETMQRSLEWARGRLVSPRAADELIRGVAQFLEEVRRSESQQGYFGYQTLLCRRGARGPPSFFVTEGQLRFLVSCAFTVRHMAQILHVSVSTVKRRLRHFNLHRSALYSDMSDSDLDERVRDVVGANDQIGPEAVRAQLRALGVRVQRSRVRQSMLRVNPRAAAQRALSQRLHRRTYRVAGPNSLWHIDGNHKLIRWRIVIHGGIDGHSRLVVFLRASNNNRASTVMNSFINAVATYGVPSRVRADHGGENNTICQFMDIFRGSSRGSSLRGRSTHNQRIERLWGDVWRGVTNVYYDLFTFLETEGIVDVDNEMHLWALHFVYLPRINQALQRFCQQWNFHGLRTEMHQSPLQLFVQGCLAQQRAPRTAVQEMFARMSPEEGVMAPVDGQAAELRQNAADHEGNAETVGETSALEWPEAELVIPEIRYSLDPLHMEELQNHLRVIIQPLPGSRDGLQVEVLQRVIFFLESMHN